MLQIGTNTNNRKKTTYSPKVSKEPIYWPPSSSKQSSSKWQHLNPSDPQEIAVYHTLHTNQIRSPTARWWWIKRRGSLFSLLLCPKASPLDCALWPFSVSSKLEKPTFLLSSKVTAARSAAQIGISTKATKGCSTKLMEWFGSKIEVEKCWTEYSPKLIFWILTLRQCGGGALLGQVI